MKEKKKYFVTSDIHSFYDEFFVALVNAGFSYYNPNHYIIICGDLFDRGKQSKELLDFLYEFSQLGRLILIRGNHEDLMEDCLEELKTKVARVGLHHVMNGTLDTIAQLTNTNIYDLIDGNYKYTTIRRRLCKYFRLINQSKDYYEIDDYVFVHGWFPQVRDYKNLTKCDKAMWKRARWVNGMEAWHFGWELEGKTVFCGHWHTSFGNYNYHHKGSGEFEENSDFGIFEDEGIVALDACTAYSKKVNIFTFEK